MSNVSSDATLMTRRAASDGEFADSAETERIPVATAERLLADRPARAGRVVSAVIDAVAAAGVIVSLVFGVLAYRAGIETAQTWRASLGWEAPIEGVDWYLLAVQGVLIGVPLVLLFALGRLVKRRYRVRLKACFGTTKAVRFPLRGGGQKAWLAGVLASPGWESTVGQWRATGALAVPESGWDDAQYHQVADLVAAEMRIRVGQTALATGLAVGVAQHKVADAVAVVAGSAELQITTLATLGLRPTPRAYLRVGRAAATGVLAATFLDVEERLETRLLIRAAAFGLDTAEGLAEASEDALAELADGAGGTAGAVAKVVGGAALGITGNVIRQTSDFVTAIGDEITEGLIVASVLHYHGMVLVADALALDEAHHRRLAPTPGRVPQDLLRQAGIIARRQTLAFSQMLRDRVKGSVSRRRWRGAK